jgi:phosphoserine aminotransferase
MEQVEGIDVISQKIVQQAADWYHLFEHTEGLKPLVQNTRVRSDTVIAIQAEAGEISRIKDMAKKAEITLGNGYGAWKQNTFRIANFPAISQEDIQALKQFLITYLT